MLAHVSRYTDRLHDRLTSTEAEHVKMKLMKGAYVFITSFRLLLPD